MTTTIDRADQTLRNAEGDVETGAHDQAGNHAEPQSPSPNPQVRQRPAHADRSTGDPAEGDGGALAYGLMVGGYPAAWAIGLGPAVWLLAPAFMALRLLQRRPIRIPPGALLFGLFLLLVAGSAIQIGSPGRAALFVLRAGWYVGAFISFLYISRSGGDRVRNHILMGLVGLWAATIAGGYLAVIAPEVEWSAPVARLLPGIISNDEFVRDLITPRAAEIQVFRFEGVTLNRPAAPYPYTNGWGSTMALLTPVAIAAIHARLPRVPRPVLVLLLMAGLVPFYLALNRGAWLTLGLGLLYGVVRRAVVNRSFLPLKLLALASVVGFVAISTTGVLTTAAEQLDTRSADSNETRASIYVETISAATTSPMIGFGGPRTNPANPSGPPLGTHGQLWAVLYAHGFVAAALYVGFFVIAWMRAGPTDPVGHWLKVALLVGIIQFPIYGHLPQQLFIMIGLVGLLLMDRDSGSAPTAGQLSQS